MIESGWQSPWQAHDGIKAQDRALAVAVVQGNGALNRVNDLLADG